MLTMILADDDYMVRETLKEVIPWEQYGIELIGEAENGRKAYELCLEKSPDILLTDIKMPFMDGLEVAMNLKDAGNKAKIVIISGIQDFNYAKTALEINAEGYILKPIQLAEIKEVLTKVVSRIDMERNMHDKIRTLKQQLQENASLLRDKFLRSLLLGAPAREPEIRERLDYFRLPLKYEDKFAAAVLQIDDYDSQVRHMAEADKQLTVFSVQNVAEEIVGGSGAGFVYGSNEREIVILFNERAQQDDKHVRIGEELIDALYKYLKISASIGIGSPVGSIGNIHYSYRNAVHAVQHRFYMGPRSLVRIEDIANVWESGRAPLSFSHTNLYETEQRLIDAMLLGDTDSGQQQLDELFRHLIGEDAESLRGFCIELIGGAYRKVHELLGEDVERTLPNRNRLLLNVLDAGHIQSLVRIMNEFFAEAAGLFAARHNRKHLELVNKIKSIVQRKFTQNLSLAEIGDEVFMSVNYICAVFKRETGITINEHLTQVRMEEAKRRLKGTKMKIWEIAELLGYDNHNYFSTVFKKYTGMQPQQYRSEAD